MIVRGCLVLPVVIAWFYAVTTCCWAWQSSSSNNKHVSLLRPRSGYQFKQSQPLSFCRFAVSPLVDIEIGLEQQAREIAATALTPVLLCADDSSQPLLSLNPEKALKKILRSIPSGTLRARVSVLVLGTSIFRLRHEYVYNVTTLNHRNDNDDTPADKVRALVDLHAAYLLQGDDDDSDHDAAICSWPVEDIDRLSLQHSMPRFLVQAWVEEYGVYHTEGLCRASNQPGPVTLRRNLLKCASNEILIQRLADDGVTAVPITHLNSTGSADEFASLEGCLRIVAPRRPPSIWGLAAWKDGWFEVQDAGSQRIVAACDVKPGETVIDYCAGNGGKTLALLSALAGDGSNPDKRSVVWAHDIVDARLAQLRGSLDRTGVHDSIQLNTTCDRSDLAVGMADIVVVDAPCSSTGVLRRRPSQRWSLQEAVLSLDFPALQLEIIQQASELVRSGGRLVYATCSLCRWENENVVAAWEASVADDGQWEPVAFPDPQPGIAHHCRKLLPHTHDSDGFFIARWKRTN